MSFFKKHFFLWSSVILLLVIVAWHNVSKTPTEEDKKSVYELYPKPLVNAKNLSFEEQILLIQDFQKTIHSKLVVANPIDYNQPREPVDLIKNHGGHCFDFSRTIEKFLVLNQFEVRHVSIYMRKKGDSSFFRAILKSGIFSHSLTEVKTKNGWLIVDSNSEWTSLDSFGNPISFKQLKKIQDSGRKVNWKYKLDKDYIPFYNPYPFYVYGLYSRHGGFYKPYSPVPDYNFSDLLFQNLSSF